MTKSINWKLWSGLLISALFLYLAFREVDVTRMWGVVRSADLFFVFLVVIITFFQYVIRAWRWAILLEPIKKTGFSNRLSSVLIGFAANCILPARLGEFIRANYLGHSEKMSRSSAFGTIVVERLFDGLTLLLVLMIGLLGAILPEEYHNTLSSLRITGFLLLMTYVLIIIFLIGIRYKTDLFLNLLEKLLFFIPHRLLSRIIDVARNFSLGLVLTKDPYRLGLVVFYSFLLWFTALYQIQLIEQSVGLSLPFIATFLILAMSSFGVMIPSAPAYIGTFHLAVKYGFLFYGIGGEEALSAAIVWHFSMFIPTIIFGVISLMLLQISLKKLREDAMDLKKDPIGRT